MKTCEACKYSHDVGTQVYCVKRAPIATVDGAADPPHVRWPIVSRWDWCGEFEPKPKQDAST